MFNQAKPKEKFKYLKPLRRAKFSRSMAKKLGFDTSSFIWKSCLVDDTVKHKSGRKPLTQNIIREINKHMESLSNIASNR